MRQIALFMLLNFVAPFFSADVLPKPPKSIAEQDSSKPAQTQEPQLVRPKIPISELPAAEALQQARLLFIRPKSSFMNKEKLERELLKRKEFVEMRLEITRSISNADLVLEITRKRLTTRFTCNVIEPVTQRILAGTTASSLGGEIEPNLADAIVKEFKAKRGIPKLEVKKTE
ncbi:MAG: hypothetical protein ACKVZH_12630 [Blastocatellia bacterium]